MHKSLAQIEAQITTDVGFDDIHMTFDARSVSRRDDFFYLLSDVTSGAIQSTLRTEFCHALSANGVAGFARVKFKVDQLYGRFSDYTAEEAENTLASKHSGALGMRQWFYQSCTEYGLWQNA